MATTEDTRLLLDNYCDAMNERDRERWLDCFADDAVQEDPVGTTPNVGRTAIGAFFDANPISVHLYQTQDPLVIGREVLAFFAVDTEIDGTPMFLPRIVDHIVLTDDGLRFARLRAFFRFEELRPK